MASIKHVFYRRPRGGWRAGGGSERRIGWLRVEGPETGSRAGVSLWDKTRVLRPLVNRFPPVSPVEFGTVIRPPYAPRSGPAPPGRDANRADSRGLLPAVVGRFHTKLIQPDADPVTFCRCGRTTGSSLLGNDLGSRSTYCAPSPATHPTGVTDNNSDSGPRDCSGPGHRRVRMAEGAFNSPTSVGNEARRAAPQRRRRCACYQT